MDFQAELKHKMPADKMRDSHSPLGNLLDVTCEKLLKKYRTYYLKQSTRPTATFFRGRSFGISNVPPESIPALEKIFRDYTNHVIRPKRHKHEWIPAMCDKDEEWVIMRCMKYKCFSSEKMNFDNLAIAREVILPFLNNPNLFKEGPQKLEVELFIHEAGGDILSRASRTVEGQVQELKQKAAKTLQGKKKRQKEIAQLEKDLAEIRAVALLVL